MYTLTRKEALNLEASPVLFDSSHLNTISNLCGALFCEDTFNATIISRRAKRRHLPTQC